MDGELLVRGFMRSDSAAVGGLLHAANAEHAAAGWNVDAVAPDRAATLDGAGEGACWVVLDSVTPVATVMMSMPPAADLQQLTGLARAPHRAWLREIAVLPSHRGRGIASSLWRLGRTWARDRGAHSVGLDAPSKALYLVELFQEWDFFAVDVIQKPDKTYRSVVMIHDLPPADSSSRTAVRMRG